MERVQELKLRAAAEAGLAGQEVSASAIAFLEVLEVVHFVELLFFLNFGVRLLSGKRARTISYFFELL